MRKISLTFAALVLALACQAIPSHATTTTTVTGTAPGPVTLSVSTSGYVFTPEIGVLIGPVTTGTTTTVTTKALPPQGFTASVALQNHTTEDISCTLGVTGTPGERFEFTVYNANGKVVWDSLPDVTMPLEILTTLPAGSSWHGSVFVPLFIKGKALPPGTYTLEASLYGSPVFTATTSFVVKNVIAIN